MAFDQTPTRNKLILIVTGITFVSLIALKFVFDSYYSIMIEEETISKIDQSTQGDQLKAIQAIEASKSAAIAGAMANLAKGDRADFAAIAPKQSDDVQALEGWIKIKRAVPTPSPVVPSAVTAPTGSAASAGSAVPVGSAAPAGSAKTDAGAPHATPGAHH